MDGRYRKSTSRIHGRKEGRKKRRKDMISDRLWQCLSHMPKETKRRLDLFASAMKNNERKEKNLEGGKESSGKEDARVRGTCRIEFERDAGSFTDMD
jgi:hypothetical protein